MPSPPPSRPWYRRKRAWAATVALLLAAYPASFAPVGYGIGLGWVSRPLADLYAVPLESILGPSGRSILRDYAQWGLKLGERHAASD